MSTASASQAPRSLLLRIARRSLKPLLVVVACWSVASGAMALAPVVAAAAAEPVGAGGAVQVVLPDSGRTVDEVVAAVRAAARDVEAADPDRDLEVILTDEIPDPHGRAMLAGMQDGDTLWVRIGVADPTRTLAHEVAHALTPGAGHDDAFLDVYLAAVDELFGEMLASREARRIAWVYHRCYEDDSCPEVLRG
jgi:hypothetical protein